MVCFWPPTAFPFDQNMPRRIVSMAFEAQRGQRTSTAGVAALIRAKRRVFGVSGSGVPSMTVKGAGGFTLLV